MCSVALLEETTALLASGGQTTELSVLHCSSADPVDSRVIANSIVGGIDEDNLEILVSSVLIDPVGVEHTEATASTANTLLGDRAEVALELDLIDTLVLGLSVDDTLGEGPLAAATADTDTVDDVSLLGLVAKAASLIGARGARGAMDRGKLSVLKTADAEKEAQYI